MSQLLAMLPDAVVVTDGERIFYVNQAASRLFGRPERELVGRMPIHLSHPESRELVRARIEAMRRGAAEVPPAEEKIARADGTLRIVESTAARIAASDDLSFAVVLRDVTELRQAQAELARSHHDLRRLVGAQEAVREDERRRIARELHDDLQQALAAIRLDLATLAARLPGHPEDARQMLDSLDRLVGAALLSTRRIVNDLRPRVLDDLGLMPALEVLASQFAQRTGIACRLEVGARLEDQQDIVGAPATCLYRVAQEALQNVAKHAQATEVVLTLDVAPGPCITLRITDNGTGMVDSDRRKPETFGLLGMHERVQALGGRLQVTGQPDRGTRVDAEIPAAGLLDAV
jgi:PAS domain S-box-containing protein